MSEMVLCLGDRLVDDRGDAEDVEDSGSEYEMLDPARNSLEEPAFCRKNILESNYSFKVTFWANGIFSSALHIIWTRSASGGIWEEAYRVFWKIHSSCGCNSVEGSSWCERGRPKFISPLR